MISNRVSREQRILLKLSTFYNCNQPHPVEITKS